MLLIMNILWYISRRRYFCLKNFLIFSACSALSRQFPKRIDRGIERAEENVAAVFERCRGDNLFGPEPMRIGSVGLGYSVPPNLGIIFGRHSGFDTEPVETYSKSLLTGKRTSPGIPRALMRTDMSILSLTKKMSP